MSDIRENPPDNTVYPSARSTSVIGIFVMVDGRTRQIAVAPGFNEVSINDVGVPVRVFCRVKGSRDERPVYLEVGETAVTVRHLRGQLAFESRFTLEDVTPKVAGYLDRRYGAGFLDEWRYQAQVDDDSPYQLACVDRIVLCRFGPFAKD